MFAVNCLVVERNDARLKGRPLRRQADSQAGSRATRSVRGQPAKGPTRQARGQSGSPPVSDSGSLPGSHTAR